MVKGQSYPDPKSVMTLTFLAGFVLLAVAIGQQSIWWGILSAVCFICGIIIWWKK